MIAPATTLGQTAAWTQWGGPRRDFMSDSKGLASSWPSSGPKKLWTRSLGEGHSSILVENGRLYTMYRLVTRQPTVAHEEVVAALDAASGKTIWEFKYAAPTERHSVRPGARSAQHAAHRRQSHVRDELEERVVRARQGDR